MIKPRHLSSVLCASAAMLVTLPIYAAEETAPNCKFPIPINKATAKEFECLSGVGKTLGNRIVEDRQKRGGSFESIEDLDATKGVSGQLLKKWKSAGQVTLK